MTTFYQKVTNIKKFTNSQNSQSASISNHLMKVNSPRQALSKQMKKSKIYSSTPEFLNNDVCVKISTLNILYTDLLLELIKDIAKRRISIFYIRELKYKKALLSDEKRSQNKFIDKHSNVKGTFSNRLICDSKLNNCRFTPSKRLSSTHKQMFQYVSQYLLSNYPCNVSKERNAINRHVSTGNLSNFFDNKFKSKGSRFFKSEKGTSRNDDTIFPSMTINNSSLLKQKNNNDSESEDEEESNETDEEESVESNDEKKTTGSSYKCEKKNTSESGKNKTGNVTSILYVDGCSLWKFPPWLVERLDLETIVDDFATLSVERYRSILMRQLKSTATDLLLYQTVRREFLRTILVIELNNIVKLLEHIAKLGLDNNLKNEFFTRLRPIVSGLDNPEKIYIPEMEEMAYVLDELYLLIAPPHVMKGNFSYHFNVIYCSYLVSHWAVVFNENCVGGIVDNNLFSNESKYYCMVMVTPQVYDEPLKRDPGKTTCNNFRVETYFDVDRGLYSGYEIDFTKSIDPKYVQTRNLECLIYTYLTREAHWVEDKNVFLLNGPGIKGNVDFTKIYYALLKGASL